MRIIYQVNSYNTRRYGRPWIAVVKEWPIGKPPVLTFGAAISDRTAEIDAKPGQIVRYGQRDHRGGNTVNAWAIVGNDGALIETDAEACREHWMRGCPVPPIADETGNVIQFSRAGGADSGH